jgi:glycosyltransferase involved in cell wall biosynthesis
MMVSLIVCTRNRAARLPGFFAHVCALESPPGGWELLIVDHASTDATPDALRTFADGAPMRVRTMRVEGGSLTTAKNAALSHAAGDILAFTDDDCYPQPDYLRQLVEVFAAHRIGVVGGRVVLHDPTDERLSVRDVPTATPIEPGTFVAAGTIHGANMAVTREVVRAVGGFDPLLGPGTPCVAAEDVEYVARAVWAGWRARYDPAPVVAHHHGRKPGPETERYRQGYDYGRGAYYTKFLLNRRARQTYLRHWYWLTRGSPWRIARARLAREMAGGRRYLAQRARHRGGIPRVDLP